MWTKPDRKIDLGGLAFIEERNLPRKLWPLGRVMKVNLGHDGWLRSVLTKRKAFSFVGQLLMLFP